MYQARPRVHAPGVAAVKHSRSHTDSYSMTTGSWLFPKGVDRERMLEMDRQLQPVRRASFAVLALALVASGPWLGWWTLIPPAVAAVLFASLTPGSGSRAGPNTRSLVRGRRLS
jgi:hypothetical protein